MLLFAVIILTCKNSPVKPVNKTSLYGIVWARGEHGAAEIIANPDYPDQCLDNKIIFDGQELKPIYNHGEYLASIGDYKLRPFSVFTLSGEFCGESIETSVQLPDTFSIISPANESTRPPGENLEIEFTNGGEGFKYVVMVIRMYPELHAITHLSKPITDTFYTIPRESLSAGQVHSIVVFCFKNGIMYGNSILAADSNNLSDNIEGFFGSWRMESVRVNPY